MKKVLVLSAVAMIALASCKKDYTCECTTEINGETLTSASEIKDAKKSDAEDACNEADAASPMVSCELK